MARAGKRDGSASPAKPRPRKPRAKRTSAQRERDAAPTDVTTDLATDLATDVAPDVTTDLAPDTVPPDDALDELYYGEEAMPAPGDYGAALDRHEERPSDRRSLPSELRELERRVRARLTPAFPIEARRRLALEPLWRGWREFAMRGRSEEVDEFGKDSLAAARLEPVLDLLHDRYFRIEVEGLEHLPDTGPAILVANHGGALPWDGALLMHAIRRESRTQREVRPLVEDFVFHAPFVGKLLTKLGAVRACPENAERLLAQEQVVAVFPEGAHGIGKLFRDRYRLQRFGRGGFVKLALRANAPLVPVAILGSDEMHPMLSAGGPIARALGLPYLPITPTFPLLGLLGLVPLPVKWKIRLGAPIDVTARADDNAASGTDEGLLIGQVAEEVRSAVQELLDDLVAARRSVFLG